ncbi:ABC transporter ATP-binding protein [Streptococcus mutans]|uniref:ABC transporter ATP-binding protein n=1 Tax=Streptococcus mutans TaxID=1309 RepID=UPI0038B77A05
MANTVISVSNLSKQFKAKKVLRDISFEVNEGDCIALIGPNGAGKTTLMSCMLGDIKTSSGQVLFKGQKNKPKAQVAVLLQENTIPSVLKVKELIAFFREIADDSLTEEEIRQLLQFSDQQYEQLAGKLSGGQRRLLAFILCLIGKPKVLFLDEPTAGMDTSTRQRFWEIVHDLKENGTTILYSSHYIEEVEHTADRILVLHQGQLIRDTTPFVMRSEDREKQVTLSITYAQLVHSLDKVYDIEEKQDTVTFMTKDLEQIWSILQKQGCSISEIEIQNKTLLNTLFDSTKGEEA